jgi:hypothetical protein
MNRKQPWIVAGATVALAGFGATLAAASDDGGVNDQRQAPVVAMVDSRPDLAQPDLAQPELSPESADSPGESPFDSADSVTDSPDDPGFVDPSPESADSPGESPFYSANSAGSAGSPG